MTGHIFKAPAIPGPFYTASRPTVFLSGSIEMGRAKLWQDRAGELLAANGFTVFNPRRDDWDSSWEQSPRDPNFFEQVSWELDMMERADSVIVYFDAATQSPITLLELGLFAKSDKLMVCCPPGFWRRGNVEMVCLRYGIPLFEELDLMLNFLLWRKNLSQMKISVS